MASILDTALLQAMLLTGQPSMAENLLRGLNYCDLKICEEILQEGSYHVALVELYKCNSMHREALEIINKSVKESESSQSKIAHRFKPEAIIEYLKVNLVNSFADKHFASMCLNSCHAYMFSSSIK
jgi:Vam6/Vps39-like protein vacuolar protein sorting-associated protein 39